MQTTMGTSTRARNSSGSTVSVPDLGPEPTIGHEEVQVEVQVLMPVGARLHHDAGCRLPLAGMQPTHTLGATGTSSARTIPNDSFPREHLKQSGRRCGGVPRPAAVNLSATDDDGSAIVLATKSQSEAGRNEVSRASRSRHLVGGPVPAKSAVHARSSAQQECCDAEKLGKLRHSGDPAARNHTVALSTRTRSEKPAVTEERARKIFAKELANDCLCLLVFEEWQHTWAFSTRNEECAERLSLQRISESRRTGEFRRDEHPLIHSTSLAHRATDKEKRRAKRERVGLRASS